MGGAAEYCCHIFNQLYYMICFGYWDIEKCLQLDLASWKVRAQRRENPAILAIPDVHSYPCHLSQGTQKHDHPAIAELPKDEKKHPDNPHNLEKLKMFMVLSHSAA